MLQRALTRAGLVLDLQELTGPLSQEPQLHAACLERALALPGPEERRRIELAATLLRQSPSLC